MGARHASWKLRTQPPGFLAREDGPRVAVLKLRAGTPTRTKGGGRASWPNAWPRWTAGLREFRGRSGAAAWRDTAVLLATEFGRTAAANGTRGTDHGTAAAAFLAGGAVAGGRVHADWPSLSAAALLEARDLKPTLDLRAVLKGVVARSFKSLGSSARYDGLSGQRERPAA